jgi:hypothetical protein
LSAFEELSEDLKRVKGVRRSDTPSAEETASLTGVIARLKNKLLDISELFNNIAMPHKVKVRVRVGPGSAVDPGPHVPDAATDLTMSFTLYYTHRSLDAAAYSVLQLL